MTSQKMSNDMRKNRQWLLARRPQGVMMADDFRFAESEIPSPAEGEVVVRNLYLSCEPAQHGWASGETYLPAVAIGDVMRAVAVGEVIASRDPRFAVGQVVQGMFGWQDYARARSDAPYPTLPVIDGVSLESSMSALGTSGLTAYFGVVDVGKPRPGETVVVSGAAGATGSMAGQIAKLCGCRVVGIAGGGDKCRYVTDELGFDDAVDYKNENLITRLRQCCPNGIDIYFDNVGGRVLDAVLLLLALRGRVVLCGAIATYAEAWPPVGPKNYLRLLRQRGRMEGFVVIDYLPRATEAMRAIAGWLKSGVIKDRVDVQHGLESAPAALARLFSGANVGKQLVKIAEPSLR
jgi:NADPH-dependent curcumin reductase CurA